VRWLLVLGMYTLDAFVKVVLRGRTLSGFGAIWMSECG
jgi:hypothetical protein